MKKLLLLASVPLMVAIGCSGDPTETGGNPAPDGPSTTTNTTTATSQPPAAANGISVQEMLISGPTQLKLHSLAMISQGNIKGEVDESYLPGLKVCAEDPALPLRSVSAQILGQHFVQDKETPHPEALAVLAKLAKDESSYVRFNAVYYGLSQIRHKSDEDIKLLIDIAKMDRGKALIQRIAESLKPEKDRVVQILDKKLQEENDISTFEIYEELTGKAPAQTDKYLEMTSSLPRLFLFKSEGSDPDASKAELKAALQKAGIENPIVEVSGTGENALLGLKTYLTRDRLTIEKEFASHPNFPIMQSMWLTPEMETQLMGRDKQ